MNGLLSEEELGALWETFLHHRNSHIAFEAFKLAQFYMFGRPVKPVASEEPTEPINIDISEIPLKRVSQDLTRSGLCHRYFTPIDNGDS